LIEDRWWNYVRICGCGLGVLMMRKERKGVWIFGLGGLGKRGAGVLGIRKSF